MGKGEIIAGLILFFVIVISFIVAIITYVRMYGAKKKLHKKELLEMQIEIQAQTMKHIGREIHDSIGQKLTLAGLYTQHLMLNPKASDVRSETNEISEIIYQSLKELRELSKSLTSDAVQKQSLNDLIKGECRRINNLKECEVNFINTFKAEVTSYQVKSILFRVTQEFLQNSIRHSGCENISVSLSGSSNRLKLHLKDDGVGFDVKKKKSKGIGLKNIEKRVQLIDGSVSLKSSPSTGTELLVELKNYET